MHVQVWTSFPRALCIWQLIVRCLLCSEIHAVFDFLGDDFVNMSSCSALLARQWIYTTRQSPVLNFTHFLREGVRTFGPGHYFYGFRGLWQSPLRCLGRMRSTCWICWEMVSGRSFAFKVLLGSTADTCTALVYEGFEEVHTFFPREGGPRILLALGIWTYFLSSRF